MLRFASGLGIRDENLIGQRCHQAIALVVAEKFEQAYQTMVDRANYYHEYFGKQFICWKTPDRPPDDLDLSAGIES